MVLFFFPVRSFRDDTEFIFLEKAIGTEDGGGKRAENHTTWKSIWKRGIRFTPILYRRGKKRKARRAGIDSVVIFDRPTWICSARPGRKAQVF